MKRICVPIGCRSDMGLSAPVIKRLKEHFEVILCQLAPQDFGESYRLMQQRLYWQPCDLVFITGDRVEMCAAAAAAFHNKVKIAHFYAGIVNDPITTFDDVDRHCITLWSDIQFCEDRTSMDIVQGFKASVMQYANAYAVGISHLDDLLINESKVPSEPYDLFLINWPSLGGDDIVHETCLQFVPKRSMIFIQGNPDDRDRIISFEGDYHYPNLPRPQFLGLLKNCQRFITNSSAAIYEAPHFLKPEQIIMVGDRNKNRPRGPFKTGASDRIVEILREYLNVT